MRKYETTYIIDGSVSDTDREALIEKIENVLTGNGAEIDRTVRWGKRQLAYEIKKQSRGYYVILYYNAEPSVISTFHHELDLNERILRYLTLHSDGKHPDYIRDAGISTDLSDVPEETSEITESIEDIGEDSLEAYVDTVENIPEEASEIIESSEDTVEEPLESDIDMGEIIPEENNSEETVIDEEQSEESYTEVTEESVNEEVSDEAENQEKEEE